MSDKTLAAAINSAIDELIKAGPAPAILGPWMDTLGNALDAAAPTADQGAASVLRANDQFLAKVIEVRGLPVRGVVEASADGVTPAAGGATVGIDMKGTFEQLEPLIRRAHAECQAHITKTTEGFRNDELEEALACFEQWARSIPLGGTKDKAFRDGARDVRQNLKAFPKWSERFYYATIRNFPNAIEAMSARANGALAALWHCYGWQNEPEHDRNNGKVFLVRGNWAIAKGLIHDAGARYTDEMPQPGNDGCRCSYQFLYNLRNLPPELLTPLGKAKLAEARKVTDAILNGDPVSLSPDQASAIGRMLSSFKKLF